MYLKWHIKNCSQAFVRFKSVKDLEHPPCDFSPECLFKCPQCPKHLWTPSSARFHHYEHQPPKYTCQSCNLQFIYQSKLAQPRQVHIWQRKYKCFHRGCNHQYKHPQDLTRHAAAHIGKTYECDICDYSSNQKRMLKCHVAIHQSEPKFKCTQCGKGFVHNNQLHLQRKKCN